ncbi:serine/threonine-protein kinase [Streptomyces sp. ZAF1911]|uniref:serine/threonine protein kinase n=1 Tax=Streptomyces sp. ZAF1911 TaxID=2944129 RepID=UPI00237AAA2B|nr:serine/threonine-protein kinase [Streptomyces sp. ZAF1911]MDD9380060.1 serine/threonine-protein kinase [Streptomyces sp. ZAF1911]
MISPLLPGDPLQIDSYRIIGRLGSGGMGTVYAALDGQARRVALKMVHAQFAGDPQFRARFHREVGVLRRVSGPCLAPFVDADPTAGVPWLVTEYVAGPTLHEHVAAYGPLSEVQLRLFAAGTAAALAAIHAAGVIHRDLKPANVILSPLGPRVLDFGIAHVTDGTAVTRTGVTTGTPGWISPEQYRDGTTDSLGDVFAWGALVAYAATGRPVFGTGAPDVLAYRVLREEPDLEGVSPELRGVIASCLAKDPGRRPTAKDVADVTSDLLGSAATQILPATPEQPTAVHDVIATQWRIPTAEDPAWSTAAPRPPARNGVWWQRGAFVAGAAAVGAIGAALLGPLPLDTSPTKPAAASTASPPQARGDERPPVPQPSNSTAAPETTAAKPSLTPAVSVPQLTRTEVHTIAPWTVGGSAPAKGIVITDDRAGSCWRSSNKTQRTDAWRCTTDSNILDPCFAPGSGPDHAALLCMEADPNHMLRLTLTQPLPGDDFHTPGDPVPTPLVIELANGETCTFAAGATTTLAGQRLNYFCEGGGSVYGDLDQDRPLWTAAYRADQATTAVSTPVKAAYQ